MLLNLTAVEKLLQMPGAYARNFAKPSDAWRIKSFLFLNLGKWALLRVCQCSAQCKAVIQMVLHGLQQHFVVSLSLPAALSTQLCMASCFGFKVMLAVGQWVPSFFLEAVWKPEGLVARPSGQNKNVASSFCAGRIELDDRQSSDSVIFFRASFCSWSEPINWDVSPRRPCNRVCM